MRNEDDRVVDETVGPEGDTIKVSPHRHEREGHHGKDEHDHADHEIRTDPAKRHGDGLIDGTGSRHGSVDTDRRF